MKFTILIIFFVFPIAFADLRVGFYSSSCPRAEEIVRQVVQRNFNQDRTVTGALLRMHFHDCFVRGCDASILIDSTKGNSSEKDAGANGTVRGFEVIDEAKRILERLCPSTVSCADIITLATRDSVSMAGGPRYDVATGRRDGLVSRSSEVNLPGPGSSVSQALQVFTANGMSLDQMVTLLGAHTVGVAHCSFFRDRLGDPNMDPSLRAVLGRICRPTGRNPTVFLDQNTSFVFDNEFYKQIVLKRGVLFLDQQLALDPSSRGLVSSLAGDDAGFRRSFVDAIVKMGNIRVLVGNDGEIRRNCRVFNSPF
ncbi:peroxidase 44 [Cajanus cajan]|uniref:Peroxidase n=1 Tax=Cajanus cajan TaxID=3821 RepID=A0A151TA33_CAJCA|nr:peroxidase 44 [Cajanus cajan]KYP63912.1 Peroxidase 44 [Cajanus cajan]